MLVYGDTVFAITTDCNLFAIDGELGQERWSVSGMSQVVGASLSRIYCMNRTSGLVVLDRQTGSRLGTLATYSLDLPYMNQETDRILLANSRGMVQCLREISQEFPLIHIGLSKQEDKPVTIPKKPAKTEDSKPADAPVDPFGVETKSDAKPAVKPEKNPDDPFGE